MSIPAPRGASVIEVILMLNDDCPNCMNGELGTAPATKPAAVASIFSDAEWSEIVDIFAAESGCSAASVAVTLLLVPTFGLSYVCSIIHQDRKASRINKRLQSLGSEAFRKAGGVCGFEVGQSHATVSGAMKLPKLWIKPPGPAVFA